MILTRKQKNMWDYLQKFEHYQPVIELGAARFARSRDELAQAVNDYLADPSRGLLVKTTLEGKDVFRFGLPEESGAYNNAGEYHPTNVAVAPNGDFYVADGYGKSWIHQYTSKAKYIRSFGGPGKDRGQTLCSHGLMVDTRGTEPILVVADRSNRRLQYFTLDGRHIRFVTEEFRAPCHFAQRKMLLIRTSSRE
jgi:hypothetical protein